MYAGALDRASLPRRMPVSEVEVTLPQTVLLREWKVNRPVIPDIDS